MFYNGHLLLIIILYVDDLLIAGNRQKEIRRVKRELMKGFKMKDLGDVKEFLGIEIIRNRVSRTLRLTQGTYICGEMLRYRSMVKLFALCSGVNPCMMMHGCTVDLLTCTR